MNRVVARELDPAATQVSKVMTEKLAVLGQDSSSEDALAVMERLHVRHLPVMSGNKLLGCVSIRELQIMELEAQEVEIEYLDDHIRNVVGW
jgi:signal-transduction protein with cAMP-binding, CBS, and nucleotidyltransferase domain